MVITSPTQSYRVANKVAETTGYRLYLCTQEETGRECLLQVAMDIAHNGALDRNSFFLKSLAQQAERVEAEYEKVRKDPKSFLNYGLGFPELLDSFVCREQGGRRIGILAFRHVEHVGDMSPLGNLVKDRLRVDLRTSGWIMGKTLKLLAFAHGLGISIGMVDLNNILIQPAKHYVVLFDWSNAQAHTDETVPAETRREEIASAARAVITILGGDIERQTFPEMDSGRYTEHLLRLAAGVQSSSDKAHAQFYELVDELWDRAFHPFTTQSHDYQ